MLRSILVHEIYGFMHICGEYKTASSFCTLKSRATKSLPPLWKRSYPGREQGHDSVNEGAAIGHK